MSKVVCTHCHLEFDEKDMLTLEQDGKTLHFCCTGCKGIYTLLHSEGLDSFYDKLGRSTLAPPQKTPEDTQRFDSDGFQARYVTMRDDGFKEVALIIEGIHCAACVWLNEKILTKTDGIIDVAINFTNNKAHIIWDDSKIPLSQIVEKIRAIGYDALVYDATVQELGANKLRRANYAKMIVGVFATMNIMWIAVALYAGYFSGIEQGAKDILHFAEFLLATLTLFYSGSIFFRGAYVGLKHGFVTMDTLVATGASLTYGYSIYAALTRSGEAYFDSVTMIITFVLIGKFLETLSKKQAVDTLDTLTSVIPTEVAVISGETISYKSIEQIAVNEHIRMRAGDVAAVDGIVVRGEADFDESSLSGEAREITKKSGDFIVSGSKNVGGLIVYRVTKDYQHSSFHEIIRLLEESLEKKPKIESIANTLSRYFSITILSLSLLTFCWWYLYSGASFGHALVIAVSVIVIACPCALALATPIASVIGLYSAAKKGAIFKSSSMLETIAKATTLVVDKTGTLTQGVPHVVNEKQCTPYDKALLYALVSASKHPVAKAVAEYIGTQDARILNVAELQSRGLAATYDDINIQGGSLEFLAQQGISCTYDGEHTLFAYAENGILCTLFELEDIVKDDTFSALEAIRASGVSIVMLTGDNERSAKRIADELHIDTFYAKMTPQNKLAYIEQEQRLGNVIIMAGDGINDALALAKADISVAMASGAEINLQISDIVLLRNSLNELKNALLIGQKTYRTIRQNILISIIYNACTIPLAAMGYVIPLVAAISMSFSSLLVVLNSTRIKFAVKD